MSYVCLLGSKHVYPGLQLTCIIELYFICNNNNIISNSYYIGSGAMAHISLLESRGRVQY